MDGTSKQKGWLIFGVIVAGILIAWLLWSWAKRGGKIQKETRYGDHNCPPRVSIAPPVTCGGPEAYVPGTGLEDESPLATVGAPYPSKWPESSPAHPGGHSMWPSLRQQCAASQGAKSCDSSCDSSWGFQLDVDRLMPASWQGVQSCPPDVAEDYSRWGKFAPNKQNFNQQLLAGGAVRLQANTRSPLSRQVGIPNLIRPGLPLPIAGPDIIWNDSSFRDDLIYNNTGAYPEQTAC